MSRLKAYILPRDRQAKLKNNSIQIIDIIIQTGMISEKMSADFQILPTNKQSST